MFLLVFDKSSHNDVSFFFLDNSKEFQKNDQARWSLIILNCDLPTITASLELAHWHVKVTIKMNNY